MCQARRTYIATLQSPRTIRLSESQSIRYLTILTIVCLQLSPAARAVFWPLPELYLYPKLLPKPASWRCFNLLEAAASRNPSYYLGNLFLPCRGSRTNWLDVTGQELPDLQFGRWFLVFSQQVNSHYAGLQDLAVHPSRKCSAARSG